jgi:hypothetical protein
VKKQQKPTRKTKGSKKKKNHINLTINNGVNNKENYDDHNQIHDPNMIEDPNHWNK